MAMMLNFTRTPVRPGRRHVRILPNPFFQPQYPLEKKPEIGAESPLNLTQPVPRSPETTLPSKNLGLTRQPERDELPTGTAPTDEPPVSSIAQRQNQRCGQAHGQNCS